MHHFADRSIVLQISDTQAHTALCDVTAGPHPEAVGRLGLQSPAVKGEVPLFIEKEKNLKSASEAGPHLCRPSLALPQQAILHRRHAAGR